MSPKTRNIIGWVLSVLVAGFMIFSASGKLMGGAKIEQMSAAMGFTMDEVRMIGILELVAALLFLIPRTGVLGLLLLTAYLGGAIATHLEHAVMRPTVITPVILEAVLWITALIRFPEVGARFFGRRA